MQGFCRSFKNAGRCGAFEEGLQRSISRGKRSTRDLFVKDVRRSGRKFLERGCILERQIFRLAKMISRDRCSTSYDLASHLRGRRGNYLRQRKWKKSAKRICTRPSALHSTFPFWRTTRRTASFFMLSTPKLEETSKLLRFWRCQVQSMRKHRRLAAFWMLPSSKFEEVSQTCCALDVLSSSKSEEVLQICCIYDVVKFKTSQSPAEGLCFLVWR